MTAVKKPVTMCCVSIGYSYYLLPADKGMKLVELLQSAFECERSFGERSAVYEVGIQPEHVTLEIVRPAQIRQRPQPETEGGRLLPSPRGSL